MNLKALWGGMLGCLLLLSGGCSAPWDGAEIPENITMPEIIARPYAPKHDAPVVDIYWDATYSMQGYTTLAAGNVYRTLPDHLGDIGDSMGEVKFYRFGETVVPLEGREHRKFSDPAYYTELITAMHQAVDAADPNHLSIIVTDLFESSADWSNIAKKLKDKYFSKHMAVAIIGVKNSFMGDIFDVGLNADKYSYNSWDDPARFRPFYLFIMGPEHYVKDFLDRWRGRQTEPNEMQYLLLTENLTEQEGDFSQLEIVGSENIFLDDRLGIKDKRMQEFAVDSMDNMASLTTEFRYQPAFGICPLDMGNLKTDVKVFRLDEEGIWQPVDSEGNVTVDVAPSENNEDVYDVSVSFIPSQTLAPDAVNFLHVAVFPDAKGYRLPNWVKAWHMPNVDVAPDQFDGSRTVNLLHVIDSLKESSLDASHPSLVNMNLVINTR